MGAVSLEGLLRIKQDIICNLLVLCEAQSRSSKVVVIITRCITVTFRIIRRFFFFFFYIISLNLYNHLVWQILLLSFSR